MSQAARTTQRLRVLVVGCGRVGRVHAQAATRSPDAELVGLCDSQPKRAQLLSSELPGSERLHLGEDFEGAFEACRPDVVLVASPTTHHFEHAKAALSRGCHVFCEKPLSETVEQAETLCQLAEASGCRLGVDYNRRFGFGYRQARQWLGEHAIGEPRHAAVYVTDGEPPEDRRTEYHLLDSVLTHHIDLLRWLVGEIAHVRAILRRDGSGRVNDAVLQIQFQAGQLGSIVAGYRAGQPRTSETLVLGGSLGQITVRDVTRAAELVGTSPDQQRIVRPNHFTDSDHFYETVRAHVADFLFRVKNERPLLVAGQDGLRAMQLVAEAVR